MKKLLISTLTASLMLSACASNKTTQERHQITVEEAMQQCQKSSNNQDRAVFDACMKDKGFLRKDAVTAQVAAHAQ